MHGRQSLHATCAPALPTYATKPSPVPNALGSSIVGGCASPHHRAFARRARPPPPRPVRLRMPRPMGPPRPPPFLLGNLRAHRSVNGRRTENVNTEVRANRGSLISRVDRVVCQQERDESHNTDSDRSANEWRRAPCKQEHVDVS
jgi:hypothetical protein